MDTICSVRATSVMPHFPCDWRSELDAVFRAEALCGMAAKTTEEICRPILAMALDKFDMSIAQVWSVDPRRERLILTAQESKRPIPAETIIPVIDVAASLTGEAVSMRQVRLFGDLQSTEGRNRFENRAFLDLFPVRCLISVPIHNVANPHQILMVLNFFAEWPLQSSDLSDRLRSDFRRYSELLAIMIESNLRERTFRQSTEVSLRLSRLTSLTEEVPSRVFAESVHDALGADWVTVFLEDWTHQQVTRRADTPQNAYPTETGLPAKVTEVWQTNREFLAPSLSLEPRPEDLVATESNCRVQSVMFVPLHDVHGKCRGVIRCVNFVRDGHVEWRRAHCYDDVAIVEAMGQAFSPPLDLLLESEQRNVSLQLLCHELRVPVVALRAVLQRMQREYGSSGFRFKYPHFNEARTYVDILHRHVHELELVRLP